MISNPRQGQRVRVHYAKGYAAMMPAGILGKAGNEEEMKDLILLFILEYMAARGIPLTKIAVQKCVYYLKINGAMNVFRFSMSTFGPYSIDLNSALDDLIFWDKITLDGEKYALYKPDTVTMCVEVRDEVQNHIDNFANLLENVFSFSKLELYSTLLYCIVALRICDIRITESIVLSEFREWKGNKFDKGDVVTALNRIVDYENQIKGK